MRSNIRHETKGLLPSFIPIKQSQSHKRILINIRLKEKTLHSSTSNETAGLLASFCYYHAKSISQTYSHKRILINIRLKEKTLHSSTSNIICKVRLYYRKFRDQGSKFSNETALAVCLRPNATIAKSISPLSVAENLSLQEQIIIQP